MSALDREHPRAFGRTTRELMILAACLGIIAQEVFRPGPVDPPNLAVYVVAALLFALRFYIARAAMLATCVAALAQQWPNLRLGEVDAGTLGLVPLLGIAALASRDLVERFDRAPSRVSWLPNLWAAFTPAETRTLRWSTYAAGALAGTLDHFLENVAPALAPAWPRPCMIALTVSLLLLCAGRAIGLLGVWAIGLYVLVRSAPLAVDAERVLADAALVPGTYAYLGAAEMVLPIALLAGAAVLLTTPVTLRLLRRTLLG